MSIIYHYTYIFRDGSGAQHPGPHRRKSYPGAKFDPEAPSSLMTFTLYDTKFAKIYQNY